MSRYIPLFIFCTYKLQPVVYVSVGIIFYKLPPFADIICADRRAASFFGHNRIRKMDIGMYQLTCFNAGCTYPAALCQVWRVACWRSGLAKQRRTSRTRLPFIDGVANYVLCEGQGQRQPAISFPAYKQQCMAETVMLYQLYQVVLNFQLA